ncbi:MAG: alpha/beta fold hydrolase [bacterium]
MDTDWFDGSPRGILSKSAIENLRKRVATPHDYITANDGIRLFYRYWYPENTGPEKILLCVHGFGSHGEGFNVLAEKLNPRGIGVIAIDQRGHGLSDGVRGDVEDFSLFMEDLDVMVDAISERHKEIPIFTLGESLGGVIAIIYAAQKRDKLSGMVLAAAGLKENSKSILKVLLMQPAILLGILFPRAMMVDLVRNWSMANRMPENVQAMKDDPLLLRRACVHFFMAIAKYHKKIFTHYVGRINIPTLILQGGADVLVSPEGGAKIFPGIKSGRQGTENVRQSLSWTVCRPHDRGSSGSSGEMDERPLKVKRRSLFHSGDGLPEAAYAASMMRIACSPSRPVAAKSGPSPK